MSIEITEEVTRRCCTPDKDLKPYKGKSLGFSAKDLLSFCTHCGQLWSFTWSKYDGADYLLAWETAKIRRMDPPKPPQTHLDTPKNG